MTDSVDEVGEEFEDFNTVPEALDEEKIGLKVGKIWTFCRAKSQYTVSFKLRNSAGYEKKIQQDMRRGEKKTMNLVATSFATLPVCNAARAAHALHSNQFKHYND